MGEQMYASGQGDPADLWVTFAQGGNVLISTRIADEHHLREGEMLRLQTARGPQEFPVAAVIIDFNNVSGVVMMTWDDVRRFYGLNSVDMYMLKVAPGADLDAVRQQIDAQYGRSGYLVLCSNADVKQSLLQSIGASMVAFNVIVLIAFIITAFSIVNTLTMNVMERTREIGLLRAVGMTRFQVSKMILAEAMVMALIGGLFGVVFGGVFSRAVVWFMNTGMGFGVSYVLPVTALLVSCVLMFAILLPVRRVSGFAIMEALRYE
jgi:putative ABC transport system permease protein